MTKKNKVYSETFIIPDSLSLIWFKIFIQGKDFKTAKAETYKELNK